MAIYTNVRKKLYTLGAVFAVIAGPVAGARAQESATASPTNNNREQPIEQPAFSRHSLGSSLFVLMNLAPLAEPPSFYQLNYNYRANDKEVFSLEAITWKYYAPLGIPYGAWGKPEYNYPGSVRSHGIGLVYKRFLWKGVYGAFHALPLRQTYSDENNDKIQTGLQLFLTLRAGYHFAFFKDRFFIEPSIAMTAWPINTNLPAAFAAQEKQWPSYFLAEPGMHFGVNF